MVKSPDLTQPHSSPQCVLNRSRSAISEQAHIAHVHSRFCARPVASTSRFSRVSTTPSPLIAKHHLSAAAVATGGDPTTTRHATLQQRTKPPYNNTPCHSTTMHQATLQQRAKPLYNNAPSHSSNSKIFSMFSKRFMLLTRFVFFSQIKQNQVSNVMSH